MPYRAVKDMDLFEVSILDRTKSPAYEGTLVTARSETNEVHFRGEDFIDEVNLSIEEEKQPENEPEVTEEVREETVEPKQQEIVEKNIDYSKAEEIIKEIRELKGEN